MKGFDEKFLEELKSKNDIVQVAGKYIQLEQRGNDYWGKCPFHHENTASFVVHGIEQFYHCFGCNKSGNVISLVMELESLDFTDAVKFLADRAKIPLPDVKYDDEKLKQQKERKARLLSLLREAALFYVGNLKKDGSDNHIEYILKRGLSAETVARFGIGASLDFDGLPAYLKSKGYTEAEMTDSGAVGCKNGRVYDSLGGRLIIPVIDQFGAVIAFCGRIIDNRKDVGKYVNTRETAVFSKGKNLFNLNNLKKLKNEDGLSSIIMVEGHMDVISLVQSGVKNVVASMGTALTKDQARILKRYCEKIFICYDGDSAGQKATVRGLEILSEEGLNVRVVSLPEGLDPDEVVKKYGAEGFKNFLSDAKPLIDFKIEVLKKSFDTTEIDGKRKFASAAIKVIKESPSAAEREDLLKKVKEDTGFTFEALNRELYENNQAPAPVKIITENVEKSEDDGRSAIAERTVLAGFLFNKPYALKNDISALEFVSPVRAEIKDYVMNKINKREKFTFSELFDRTEDGAKDELSLIAGYSADDNDVSAAKYYDDCVKILLTDGLSRKLDALIKLYGEETDETKRKSIMEEIKRITSEKARISKS